MDVRLSSLLIVACLLACGCRRDPYVDAYFEMLNAEKRALEDRVYDLEYEYEQKLQELEACRKQAGEKRPPARGSKAKSEKRTPAAAESESPPSMKIELPPGLEPPATNDTSAAASHPVTLVSFNAAETEEAAEVTETKNTAETKDAAPAPSDDLSDSPPRPPPELWQEAVTSIYLNTRRTRGEDFDRQPGDDGVSVLVEPRNRAGRFVAQPGKVSIVLLDPAEQGEAARVARWDFDADAAARCLRPRPPDRGLLFRVRWPDEPPAHERLQLFVRYETADGHRLQAQREITVRLADKVAQDETAQPPDSEVRPAAAEQTAGADSPAADPPTPTTIRAVHVAPAAAPPSTSGTTPSQPVGTGIRGRFWKPYR